MSLSRAFLHAGAAATVATLWDVPDAPGPVFADVLYRELAAGQPLGQAVADARRELRRRGAPPRSWAAYVLTGNPGARVGITARTPVSVIAARAIAGLAAILLLAAIIAALARTRLPRIRWAQLATAGVVFAATAATLQFWAVRDRSSDISSIASRSAETNAFVPFVDAKRTVSWPSVAGADEHVIQLYSEDGKQAAPATAAAAPFTIPQDAGAAWIRVAARRDGRNIARSALMRVAP